jgi:hypothetical protein
MFNHTTTLAERLHTMKNHAPPGVTTTLTLAMSANDHRA